MNNPHRNEHIATLEKGLADHRKQMIEAVRTIQDRCPHDKIVADTLGSGARRICCQCGLEEMNRYYSWPGETTYSSMYEFSRPSGLRTVLNGEFVKVGDVPGQRIRL